MEIHYCAKCRTRVSSYDLEEGRGLEYKGNVYCDMCTRKLELKEKKAEETGKTEPVKIKREEVTTGPIKPRTRRTRPDRERPAQTDRRERSAPARAGQPSTAAYICIAAGAVLVLILLIVLISSGGKKGRGKKRDIRDSTTQTPEDTSGDDTSSNSPPRAAPDSGAVEEDGTVFIDVLSNDSDPDGDTIRVLNTGPPSYGSAVNMGKRVKYSPSLNYHGTDTFTYTVIDSRGNTARGSVTVTVKPVNDPPSLEQQSVNTNTDTPVNIRIMAADPDNDEIEYTIVSQPQHGALGGTPPQFVYTPDKGFKGTDVFTVKASDGTAESTVAAVTINVAKTEGPGPIDPDPVELPQGLAAYWKFDEGSGKTAADSSGLGYDGILKNGVGWAAGRKGKALTFDSDTNVMLLESLKDNDAFHSKTREFTVSCWVTIEAYNGGFRTIYEEGGTQRGFILGYETGSKKIVFSMRFDSADKKISSVSELAPDSAKWVHIAAVYSKGAMELYINGKKEGRRTAKEVLGSHGDDPGVGGVSGSAAYKGTPSGWKGKIDELRIYRKQLPSAKIEELAAETGTGDTEGPDDTPLPVPVGKIDVKVNFQPEDEETPEGYLKDSGKVYGDRGNGFTHGWSEEMIANTRKRGKHTDPLLDTLMVIPRKSTAVWEIAVPNGIYDITISVGDASGAWQGISAEGNEFWKNEYLGAGKFTNKTETVKVTDGRITLKQGDERGLWSRLNYIQIKTTDLK